MLINLTLLFFKQRIVVDFRWRFRILNVNKPYATVF